MATIPDDLSDAPQKSASTNGADSHKIPGAASVALDVTIETTCQRFCGRSEREMGQNGRRANHRLTLGVMFALLGLFSLGWEIHKDTTSIGMADRVLNHLPYLCLGVMAEVLAFVLFRLHTSCLNEVRYRHDELYNMEMWALSARIATGLGDTEMVRRSLDRLSRIDRNSVWKSSQTTADLERARLDAQGFRDSANVFSGLFKPKK
jgi:hypothetical protein